MMIGLGFLDHMTISPPCPASLHLIFPFLSFLPYASPLRPAEYTTTSNLHRFSCAESPWDPILPSIFFREEKRGLSPGRLPEVSNNACARSVNSSLSTTLAYSLSHVSSHSFLHSCDILPILGNHTIRSRSRCSPSVPGIV